MSMSCTERNGKASLLMSADVSACISSRDLGPWMLIWLYAPVTSVTMAWLPSGVCRFIHVSTCRCAVSVATTMYLRHTMH